ncbi:unnamed protein product [Ectocarpus fasciculatus]
MRLKLMLGNQVHDVLLDNRRSNHLHPIQNNAKKETQLWAHFLCSNARTWFRMPPFAMARTPPCPFRHCLGWYNSPAHSKVNGNSNDSHKNLMAMPQHTARPAGYRTRSAV